MPETTKNSSKTDKETHTDTKSWFKKSEGIIVSITALLVVIPALINSAIDVHDTVMGIPDGKKEKQNLELFKAHFKDSPVFSQPFGIKSAMGDLNMHLDVYSNGDIYRTYALEN